MAYVPLRRLRLQVAALLAPSAAKSYIRTTTQDSYRKKLRRQQESIVEEVCTVVTEMHRVGDPSTPLAHDNRLLLSFASDGLQGIVLRSRAAAEWTDDLVHVLALERPSEIITARGTAGGVQRVFVDAGPRPRVRAPKWRMK